MRTPSPHQSTARVYDVSVKTSGAKNSGVPQNVLVRSRKPIPETRDRCYTRVSGRACVALLRAQLLTSAVAEPFTFFTQAKISNLYISLCVQEQVIQLQISAKEIKRTRLKPFPTFLELDLASFLPVHNLMVV